MTRKKFTNVGFSLLLLTVASLAIGVLSREVFCQQLPTCDGTVLSTVAKNCPDSSLTACDFVGRPCTGQDAQLKVLSSYPNGTFNGGGITTKIGEVLYPCLKMAKCQYDARNRCIAVEVPNGAISYGSGHGYVNCVIPG